MKLVFSIFPLTAFLLVSCGGSSADSELSPDVLNLSDHIEARLATENSDSFGLPTIHYYGIEIGKTNRAELIESYQKSIANGLGTNYRSLKHDNLYDSFQAAKKGAAIVNNSEFMNEVEERLLSDGKTGYVCFQYRAARNDKRKTKDCFFLYDNIVEGFNLSLNEDNCQTNCSYYSSLQSQLNQYEFLSIATETISSRWRPFDKTYWFSTREDASYYLIYEGGLSITEKRGYTQKTTNTVNAHICLWTNKIFHTATQDFPYDCPNNIYEENLGLIDALFKTRMSGLEQSRSEVANILSHNARLKAEFANREKTTLDKIEDLAEELDTYHQYIPRQKMRIEIRNNMTNSRRVLAELKRATDGGIEKLDPEKQKEVTLKAERLKAVTLQFIDLTDKAISSNARKHYEEFLADVASLGVTWGKYPIRSTRLSSVKHLPKSQPKATFDDASLCNFKFKKIKKPSKEYREIVKRGRGSEIASGDTVKFDFSLCNQNGQQLSQGENAEYVVGSRAQTNLYDLALKTMKPGSVNVVTIPMALFPDRLPEGISTDDVMVLKIQVNNAVSQKGDTPKKSTPSSELVMEDIVRGKGKPVKEGDTITVHYFGKIYGGAEFDNSYKRSEPATFKLASGQLIEGWVQGIVGMRVGGKRKLTIPPNLGYGARTIGSIPGNSTLEFEIELLGID